MSIASINADGWTAQWTSGTPSVPDPDGASPLSIPLNRAGFDGTGATTTIAEAIAVTTRLRQDFPNDASPTASTVVLADYVYATDTAGAVANGSAEASPKPVANWAQRDRQTITGQFRPEIVAAHRNGIACVRFVATDGTSTVTANVSTPEISDRGGDVLPVIVYRPAAGWLASLADGPITISALVFPRVGTGNPAGADAAAAGSILRSQDQAMGSRLFCNQFFRKGVPTYVYVAIGGNDTAGAVSTNAATAAATPCATIKGALERALAVLGVGQLHSLEIRLGAGQWATSNVAFNIYQSADSAEVVITRDPAVARSAVKLTLSDPDTRIRWLHVTDIDTERTLFRYAFGLDRIALSATTFDNNNIGVPLSDRPIYFDGGVTVLNPSQLFNQGDGDNRLLRGVTCAQAATVVGWNVLGSSLAINNLIAPNGGNASGGIVAFNRFLSPSGVTSGLSGVFSSADVNGYAAVQNVFEWCSGSDPAFAPSADGQTRNITHLIAWANSFAGSNNAGRGNILYDDTPATRRVHKLISFVGNIHVQINTKGARFLSNAAAKGNWPYMHGVGCVGEVAMFRDAGGGDPAFQQFYPGRRAAIGTSNTVRLDPGFVQFRATTFNGTTYTAGLGGGDYRLSGSGTAAFARIPAGGRVLPFDLQGRARLNDGNGAAGAYERDPLPVGGTGGGALAAITSGGAGAVLVRGAGAAALAALTLAATGGGVAGVAGSGGGTLGAVTLGATGVIGGAAITGAAAAVLAPVSLTAAGTVSSGIVQGEPITLEEAKRHARIDGDDADDDAVLARYIVAARRLIEQRTGQLLIRRQVEQAFDRFEDPLRLRAWPSPTGVAVTYVDPEGVERSAAGARLFARSWPPRVSPPRGASWPAAAEEPEAVRVTVEAGYAAGEVPQDLIVAMLMLIAHWHRNREAVAATSMAKLPTGVEDLIASHRMMLL